MKKLLLVMISEHLLAWPLVIIGGGHLVFKFEVFGGSVFICFLLLYLDFDPLKLVDECIMCVDC